jgi:hypothetical protein
VRNSLLTSNATAVAGDAPGALVSTYNALFGNQADYVGTAAGTGDVSGAVTFADLARRDLRLTAPQPSTDRGDPADDVGAEPMPNGGRINMGAFGGTADAELTAPSTTLGGAGQRGATPGTDPHDVGTAPTPTPTPDPDGPGLTGGGDDDGGCRVGGRAERAWLGLVLVGACALLGRRRARPRSLK